MENTAEATFSAISAISFKFRSLLTSLFDPFLAIKDYKKGTLRYLLGNAKLSPIVAA